jgi:hypothetical protein
MTREEVEALHPSKRVVRHILSDDAAKRLGSAWKDVWCVYSTHPTVADHCYHAGTGERLGDYITPEGADE